MWLILWNPLRVHDKKGSVRTRCSAISIPFKREQTKPHFQIPHVMMCLEYWCAASHIGLLNGLKKWIGTQQGSTLHAIANMVTKYHPHDSRNAVAFRSYWLSLQCCRFLLPAGIGTVRKSPTWKKDNIAFFSLSYEVYIQITTFS